MNKLTLLVAALAAALLMTDPVLAKGKEKHHPQSQLDNTNRQSLDDSLRAQERAGQRHEMHDQEEYGQARRRIENPVDTLIDRNVDQLKSGAHDLNRRAVEGINEGARDLAPPHQPSRR